MKKYFIIFTTILLISCTNDINCKRILSNAEIKISNGAKLEWVKINGETRLQTKVDIFSEGEYIDSLVGVKVFITRYWNEATLKDMWISSDLGNYEKIYRDCQVWICENKIHVAIGP